VSRLKNKNVLVTGATGMVGIQLVNLLIAEGANVSGVSIDIVSDKSSLFAEQIHLISGDLRSFELCLDVTKNQDFVFHVAGIKGSPQVALKRPNTFFYNTSKFNLNVIEASRRNLVPEFLYTSSIGVYSPAEIFNEDDVWKTFPSENDRYAGWAKRMGELQIEAAGLEHNWNQTYIVRPANIYGPWDNFDPENAMVIPSLIARAMSGENPLKVWGGGDAVRDFIHAKDVARAMIHVVEHRVHHPVNVGSGIGISISEIANEISKGFDNLKIEWDTTKPTGDKIRVMNTERIKATGFKNEVSLNEGIASTIEWFKKYQLQSGRYNAFTEKL
jgi:GDP-L-fucose synthase